MGLADYSAFLHLSSDDSSEWVRPSRLSRCSYRIKNDRILLLRKLNTFAEVIQTFTPLDLLSLSCNGGMKLKHIPKVWRFWFGMVPRASLIPRSSKSMMWYAINHYSIWTPPVAHFLLEGVNYICRFRKVRFHILWLMKYLWAWKLLPQTRDRVQAQRCHDQRGVACPSNKVESHHREIYLTSTTTDFNVFTSLTKPITSKSVLPTQQKQLSSWRALITGACQERPCRIELESFIVSSVSWGVIHSHIISVSWLPCWRICFCSIFDAKAKPVSASRCIGSLATNEMCDGECLWSDSRWKFSYLNRLRTYPYVYLCAPWHTY